MAQRARPSITKRQKELSRQEKRQEKAERRDRRKQERAKHAPDGSPPAGGSGETPSPSGAPDPTRP
jgi:hypothetical protein